MLTHPSSLLCCEHSATVCCLNISNLMYFSARWSSLRRESMRRPSTSSCTSPTTGGAQTTPCWKPQGAPQDALITWMRTTSENVSNEFVGFISNDPTTAHTTTSDLSAFDPSACVSVPGQSLHHACALHHPAPLCLTSTLILPVFPPGDYYEMTVIQQCVVVKWFCVCFCLCVSDRL